MESSVRVLIPLVGGLGNQLFILNFAKMMSATYEVQMIIDRTWLHDERNQEFTQSLVKAFGLTVNRDIEITFLERKLINSFFRALTLSKIPGLKYRVAEKAIEFIAEILYSVFVKRHFSISKFEPNVRELVPDLDKDTVLIGYFQIWQIVNQGLTNDALNSIWETFPRTQRIEIQELIRLHTSKESVLIHHRLGDYETDSYFANLPKDYFIDAVNMTDRHLRESNHFVVTNDVNRSKEILAPIKRKTFLENQIGLSDLAWIILGREFKNFVLSNSTFGWWMAFLSHQPQCVIYPNPWFEKFKYDVQIAPPEWHKLNWDRRE